MKALLKKPDKAASSAPGVDSKFEKGKRGWLALDNSVTFSDYTGVRNYRREAKNIWAALDYNGDGTVDQQEIAQYLIEQNVFAALSVEDSVITISKLFSDIDKDGNGTLDFEEFCDFYKMVQHEKNQMLHASRHHITCLPPSIVKFNKKAFTTEAIEIQLQDKIQQFTSQDSDRFRQILNMFKTQVQRSKDHDNERNQVMGVSKRQFNTVLMWLGLSATKEQAEFLFDKYDINGDGVLTVHEFLTKARQKDYPGRMVNHGESYLFRTGKRMFLDDILNGCAVRPNTPPDDVFHVSEKTIAKRIRAKMGNAPGVGIHYNETPLALNDLIKIFSFYDPKGRGFVTQGQLKRALQNLNLSVGETHLELLMDKFNRNDGGESYFDYPKFCFYVYPGKPSNASLPKHTSLQLRPPGYGTRGGAGGGNGYGMSKLDFSQSVHATPRQDSQRAHSRQVSARLAHSQRLKPLSGSGRRSLAPSASMTALHPRSGRSLSRTASTPQFRARATTPYGQPLAC